VRPDQENELLRKEEEENAKPIVNRGKKGGPTSSYLPKGGPLPEPQGDIKGGVLG